MPRRLRALLELLTPRISRASIHFLRTRTAVLAVALTMAACSEEATPPSMDDVRSEIEPTQQSWNVHYVVSEAGKRADESRPRLEILADYMATFETDDSTYTLMRSDTSARRVLAYLYDEQGDTSATVHADRLILHEKDRRFEARGGVVVETPEDKTLESEHLVWMEDDRSVRTPGFVRIRTPKERVQGYNLVADEDLETYTLARVTGQVEVEEGDEDGGEGIEDGGERIGDGGERIGDGGERIGDGGERGEERRDEGGDSVSVGTGADSVGGGSR